MDKNDILILTKLVDKLNKAGTADELEQAIEGSLAAIENNDVSELRDMLYKLGDRILKADDEHRAAARSRRISRLTDDERAELEKVEQIIDENLLKYHFQPIVSALDGEIFGYEALMRSAGDPKITPFHILKYAGLGDRLCDIEKATFVNVLNIIEQERARLGGRSVFINSIPNVLLEQEDTEQVLGLLRRNADTAVVELTEIAEADESQLRMLKDRYSSMNVRIAVDDFGTGYSNMTNLLRYTPNFVKIDRSLLSEINEDPKKRHLVRDIIEFCHDNGILALAEGVETAEELKTVVLMGVDLIQGYYTARPSAEMNDSIPYEIKQDIKRYQLQRQDGKESRVYKVEGSERVLLAKLKKHGYECIRIMPSEEAGLVSVIGDPSLDTDIHIEIDSGYHGLLGVENVRLSNAKNRPCIQLAEDCKVELSVYGECVLSNGGIYVPESSELEITGVGVVRIKLRDPRFFGIGAPHDERHGRLSFSANAEFEIDSYGQLGTCIGSGLGGEIDIHKGLFSLITHGCNGVGIGALTGDTELEIYNCGINASTNFVKGAVIGSYDGNLRIHLTQMSFNGVVGGKDVVCIGSVGGNAIVDFENSNFITDTRADRLRIMGSLGGESEVVVKDMSVSIEAGGHDAYAFGGAEGSSKVSLLNTDVRIKLTSDHDGFTAAEGDDMIVEGGRYSISVNGNTIDVK